MSPIILETFVYLVSFYQWLSTWDSFAFRGHLTMSEDILGCLNWKECAIGIWWIEAKDVTKHPTVHMTIPDNKEESVLNCK